VPVFRLPEKNIFPDPDFAEPDGLLAVGGDLTPERLLAAYSQGIFPWYSEGEPILWWSTAPRLVLFPEEFHLPRRLARTIRQEKFSVTLDQEFGRIIRLCANSRTIRNEATWITDEMMDAYIRMHELGYGHSVECWQKGRLVGGLYGLVIDRVFFGESMFSLKNDASKVALVRLVDECRCRDIRMIDCQMTTSHLLRFGARELSRQEFSECLARWIQRITPPSAWVSPMGKKTTGPGQTRTADQTARNT